jgi:hypothetical protein
MSFCPLSDRRFIAVIETRTLAESAERCRANTRAERHLPQSGTPRRCADHIAVSSPEHDVVHDPAREEREDTGDDDGAKEQPDRKIPTATADSAAKAWI